jgi:wyosine [tRNA(Phe)-imidazoG37] synthetase (radical SAM superfamily)
VAPKEKYLFGPVPSRRLGQSLGVDIVPRKVCTLDCVYCQVGRSTEITIERKEYVSIEPVISELKNRIAKGLQADFITISGSGEPTLNSKLGDLVGEIKKITNIPIAILTNGTLLFDASVRADCAKADVVLPSLDAGDEATFQKINRPHKGISIEKVISGLCQFRREYKGQIWLEVFFVEGINTGDEQIEKIRDAIAKIRPDKVQLNTAIRPTADEGIRKVADEKLGAIAAKLGANAEVIADFATLPHRRGTAHKVETPSAKGTDKSESLFSVLKRRPCSLEDLCSGLGWGRDEVIKQIKYLEGKDAIISEEKNGVIFFKVKQGV